MNQLTMNVLSKAFLRLPWHSISDNSPSREEPLIVKATGGVDLKPTMEEVLGYAENQIKYYLLKKAKRFPEEQREEMAQEARIRVFEIYPDIQDHGWKAFVQNHVRGAILDYRRAGKGFAETRESLEEEKASGEPVLRHRMNTFCESEQEEMDLEKLIARVKGRENDVSKHHIKIDWDALSRLASMDKGLHIFIRHVLLDQDLTELAPVFGVTRERCGQLLREFAGRLNEREEDRAIPDDYPPGIFNDPNELDNPWVNQIITALGLADILGVKPLNLQARMGNTLNAVDFRSFEPLYPPEAKDEVKQMSFFGATA